MKRVCITSALLFTLGGFGIAYADDSDIPDLRGLWVSLNTECHHPFAETDDLVVELHITEQDGRFLRGTRSWAHEGEAVMDAGGELVTEATEIVVGVIRGDNVTVHFVEHDDLGQHFMRLLDENRLEDVYAESGLAAAICIQHLVRQES